MTDPLPAPVARAIEAVNAGDTDKFLSEFAPDGWIDDNGRRFVGRDEMRAWSDHELIGADSRFDVTGSEPTDRGVAVDIKVASDGFNGYSRFDFVVKDEALRRCSDGRSSPDSAVAISAVVDASVRDVPGSSRVQCAIESTRIDGLSETKGRRYVRHCRCNSSPSVPS